MMPPPTPAVPLAYLNGCRLPQAEAHLAWHDAGFVLGATVTDLCRTVRHRLYRWEDHLARFRHSCRAASLVPPLGEDELTRIAQELVVHNTALLQPHEDLALVVFITPGPIGYYGGGAGGAGDAEPTFGMHTFPLPLQRYRRLFAEGAHLVTPATRQVPASCVDPRIKQRSRMHWWLADREVHAQYPGATALLLDEHGNLTETAAANVLVVKAGTVLSPPRDTILGGISLLVVEELCGELSLPFVERPLTVEDTHTADEMMLTSTPYCLAGVSRFNGRPLPWPGALWQRLLAAWSERLGLDVRRQIEQS
jgi:branched-subunit amino acid aminotransferase/4-amino-4-deoxychorismate lyase